MYYSVLAKPSRRGLVLEVGNGKYIDTSGKGNAITNNGTTLTTGHNGRTNKGFAFNGIDQYIEFAGINVSNPLTIILGINPINISNIVEYILAINSTSTSRLGAYFYNQVLNITTIDTTYYTRKITHTFDLNKYYFLIITKGNNIGGTKTVFLDSLNKSTSSGTAINPGALLVDKAIIGSDIDLTESRFINMSIDYLSIINNVITDNNIKKNYNYWRSH